MRPVVPPRLFTRPQRKFLNDLFEQLVPYLNPHAVAPLGVIKDADGVHWYIDPSVGLDSPLLLTDPIIEPTKAVTIGTDQNDYDFENVPTLSITPSSSFTITGLLAGEDGQKLSLYNAGSNLITLANNSGSSATGNQIKTPDGTSFPVRPGDTVKLKYDLLTGYWLVDADPPPSKLSDPLTYDSGYAGTYASGSTETHASGSSDTYASSSTVTFNSGSVVGFANAPTFTGGGTLDGLFHVIGLFSMETSSFTGGPGWILFTKEVSGDPSQRFVPPNTDSVAPGSAPGAAGLFAVFDAGGFPEPYLSEGTATAADWVKVRPVRPLFDHFADVSNGTTVETDLYSDTIAANTLTANGDKLIARYAFNIKGSATAGHVRVYFAGTLIYDTGAITGTATDGWLDVLIVCTGSTTARSVVAYTGTLGPIPVNINNGLTSLDFTTTNILKITGQDGAASAKETAYLGIVTKQAAA